ncbi:hypothetical protein F66182_10365, partial [Fusarium sp. NRRL 66182]
MGVFKSLGLSPAKKAGEKVIRRLFGRVMPTAEGDSASASASASASDTDQTGRGNTNNEIDNSHQKNHVDSSTSPSTSTSTSTSAPKDQDSTTTETPATTHNMASPLKRPVLNGDRNKENQPPNATGLTESLTRLNLQGDVADLSPQKPGAAPAAPA